MRRNIVWRACGMNSTGLQRSESGIPTFHLKLLYSIIKKLAPLHNVSPTMSGVILKYVSGKEGFTK